MSAIREVESTSDVDVTVEEPRRVERRRIGRYRLVFQLAAGGMATVYLARVEGPSGFDKLVALKRIHPHLSGDGAYIDMFLDEARIASRITHANVCSVFDFGEAEGEYYIAMEYLVGETLARVIRHVAKDRDKPRSPVYPSFCARIIADACEGLHAAHELKDARGDPLDVVHRDISPQNIFVSYDGVVRIVDFGIASARDKLYQTTTGEVKGKFAYMSPEQLRESEKVDRRTDVWALGVVLWEMLSMRRLFRKATQPETMYAVLEAKVPPPSSVRSGIPVELDAIVLKALKRDPEDRWPTTRAMGRALVEFVAKSGHPMGLADISEWMADLFPGGEARTRQIMDIARLPDDEVPSLARDSVEMGPPDTLSSIRTVAATPGPTARHLVRTPWGWIAGAMLIAGALGGAAFAFSGLLDPAESAGPTAEDPSTGSTANAAPSEVEPGEIEAGEVDPGEVETEAPAPTPEPTAAGAPAPPDEGEAATTPEPAPATEPVAHAARRRRRRARGGAEASAPPTTEPPSEPAPEPEPSPPASTEPGTVSVIVTGGWANVYDEGGTFLGATPLRVELPAGRHRLQLRPFGQPPPTYLNVNVPAGGRARVRHAIEE